MEKAKFTIAPILFIALMVVGVIICYYTGNIVIDTSEMIWPFKVLSVFLGGMLWVLLGFIAIIIVALYEEFKLIFY